MMQQTFIFSQTNVNIKEIRTFSVKPVEDTAHRWSSP